MPVDVIMPKVDMVMDEGTVARWLKAEGEPVQAGEPLFEIETDKATMEVEAPATGTLQRIAAPTGTTVPVATVIATILEAGERPEAPGPPVARPAVAGPPAHPSPPVVAGPQSGAGPRPRATPLARKLAREHGVDLAALAGGGPQGRIRKGDVLRALETAPPAGHPAPGDGRPATVQAPPEAEDGRLVRLVGVRKVVAQRMAISATIPQFVLSIDVELSAALSLRERRPDQPSLTAILARVVAALLPRHPTLNASFRDDGIWLHAPVHLGIALDSDGDLLVPVIRNAHGRTLGEITAALADLRQRAEAKKLTPGELRGSTFTLSNLGMLGIDRFTALINPPEAAILAVGRSARRPVEANDGITFKPMLTLTLSADHRVTDGATAARFLQDVRAAVEEPALLL